MEKQSECVENRRVIGLILFVQWIFVFLKMFGAIDWSWYGTFIPTLIAGFFAFVCYVGGRDGAEEATK